MRYIELKNIEPEVGDVIGLELGSTLIETVIIEVRNDGVVLSIDQDTVNIMLEATQVRRLAENRLVEAISSSRVRDNNFTDHSRYASIDDLIDKDKTRREPNKTQEPETDIPPESNFHAGQQVNPKSCKNAIKWGQKTLKDLDRTLRRELSLYGTPAVIEYLKIVAREDHAYSEFNFSSNDLVNCQQLLNTVTDNLNIKNWNDVLKNLPYNNINEAEYQGRKVSLGKPTAGDVKKSKVYVKGPKGNVVKVNFGDPNMRIKKSNPARRKSFRARHNCANPGPRWKARYWSCRAW